jgi:1,5-anhydro-D-fructose reductase (1,5-anhydro-D-mannitol-forming)
MEKVRWGMIGCGEVAELKSGPGFQKAQGSALAAVMRRDVAKAEDFARRHGVPRVHRTADELVRDEGVDAVYIATPPSSHCELALKVAGAGKPCLVEKPMAMNHAECLRMIDGFRNRDCRLWVAYYRRALPRFLKVRELLGGGAVGRVTSLQIHVTARLATPERASAWRFDPEIAGAGLFLDLASHCLDLVDFLLSPVSRAAGFAVNTGGRYGAEDVTAAAFQLGDNVAGTGIWNFNASQTIDRLVVTGSDGELRTPIFTDIDDVVVSRGEHENVYRFRNPPHVHQPLIQTIVDEMLGHGRSESTGESGARASWVMDRCLETYYRPVSSRQPAGSVSAPGSV